MCKSHNQNINQENTMSKNLIISTHLDTFLAEEVALGRKPWNTPVGKTRIEDRRTGRVDWETLFVHFDDGVPRRTESGALRFNHR